MGYKDIIMGKMATRRKCCGCHKNGACRWCVCVKNGLKCVSCAPKESGRCQNLTSSQASQSQPRGAVSSPDRHGLNPVSSVSSSLQSKSEALVTTVSSPASSSTVRNPSSAASSRSSVAGAVSPSSSTLSPSNSLSLPPSRSPPSVSSPSDVDLPSYQPVSTANFAWCSGVPARE
uniref:Tesmin/TSO1-like CXC domain-containing protein n=1 Tax=Amphimedon queenslandica TaxID=400682 RepID=A0A1X7SRC1_AMPQE